MFVHSIIEIFQVVVWQFFEIILFLVGVNSINPTPDALSLTLYGSLDGDG